MAKTTTALLVLYIFALACSGSAPPAAPVAPPATPSAAALADTDAAVAAASSFLSALDDEQRAAAGYPLDSDLRPNWSNLPAGPLYFERNGVRIANLNGEQRELLQQFLQASLGSAGYAVVAGIVGADGVLASHPNAGRLGWSTENYWLAFFGEPDYAGPWAWQFGGHHLAVNVTYASGRAYLSPTLLGIEPGSYNAAGASVAPMDAHVAAGQRLINALDPGTREAAHVGRRPDELHAGAREDGTIPDTEGSPVSGWSESPRQLLLDAAAQWVGLLPEASAQTRMSEIAASLDQTHFAWHGSADGSGDLYYRIQNPTLIIEFSTQGDMGAADGGHYHSIYRNPANEYGRAAVE